MAKRSRRLALDMTSGSPLKIMMLYSAPMILSNLFQQFYNIVDALIVGKFLGADALAAVGSAGTVTLIYTAFAAGLALGASVVISQFFGGGELRRVRTCASTMATFNAAVGLLFVILGLLLSRPILRLINTPESVLIMSTSYLQIYSVGSLGLFLYNALNAVYIALGNSRTPLYFLILSSVLNVVLDLFFILVLGWGVAGAAWATTISQTLSAALALFDLYFRLRGMAADEKPVFFDFKELGLMLKYAIPATIQQSVVAVGNVFVQSAINHFGEFVMAGCTAAMKVFSLANAIPMNIGNAISNFSGQNVGAGKPERVSKGLGASLLIACFFSALMTLIIALFAEPIISLFLDKGEAQASVEIGVAYIQAAGWFFVVFSIMSCTKNAIKGAGDMLWFIIATFADFLIRVFAAIFLSPIYGAHMIWWSIPIGWCVGAVIAVARYLQGGWRKKSILGRSS